jgi:hypothetical protein
VPAQVLRNYFESLLLFDLDKLAARIEGRANAAPPDELAEDTAVATSDAAVPFRWAVDDQNAAGRDATLVRCRHTEPHEPEPEWANLSPEGASSPASSAEPEVEAGGGRGVDYYDKFSTGFVGTFGGAEVFFGGLAGLVGDCRRDVLAAMADEHLAVAVGYGASDIVFKTSNYKVETTPRKEWLFVFAPEALAEALPAGVSQASGRTLGARAQTPWRHFLEHAPALISAKFAAAGHAVAVGAEEFARLEVRREEVRRRRRFRSVNLIKAWLLCSDNALATLPQVIGLRRYTGPMFELYNGVLRAWANGADPGIVPAFAAVGAGLDVCGRFTSTLHAVNSGVVKLSQLQPATVVYRGVSGMKLPEPFLVLSKFNVRGGVEYGFMSATLDQRVALRYATSNPDEPSTLMVMQVTQGPTESAATCQSYRMHLRNHEHESHLGGVDWQMGMVDRGAQLDWLSQYPDEKEILLPPLTGMEVQADEVTAEQVRTLTMRLSINLRSTTLEQLEAARQKELGELAGMADKVGHHAPAIVL